MSASNYDEALRRVLQHEGGYTHHPSDPGGPTNFGITIHDYRRHAKPGATAADVKAMKRAEAKAIYRSKYWDAQRCDELPAGIDYAVFDYGVNSGVARSGKVLRRVLGLPSTSHAVTDAVIAAAGSCNAEGVIAAICDERLAFLKRLKTWAVFGAGWGRRVAEVRGASLAMARSRPAAKRGAGAAIQVGAAAAIATAGVAAAQQADQAGARPAVIIVIVVVILLATVALACAGWWWWRRRSNRRQEG